ncbi:MAG TPA: bifunctional demethylmenaquinone methyltransferase/2-methoxy-6-polyprenyl-1,4-benzoquinol methylase UbiE [Chlamydiales bacterium]|nr:bifunctional demethylmenaquinone methyltransferase/2-methoxy-6-polyprenyl-1,4-benzoquinol methylase UbiE [Chlamydiales bacterium]
MGQEIVNMFNEISSTYDRINLLLSFGQDRSWRKKMASLIPQKKGLSHLDLATGTGDQILSLWQHSSNLERSVGIDPAEKMLVIAKEKLKGLPAEFQVGFAEKIPSPEMSFDLVTISFGIRNTENPQLALQEMYRVLKPGGRALILEFSLPSNPLIKAAHLFYLRNFVPFIGGLFSKSPSSYRYLNETIEKFPYGNAFLNWMDKAGFKNTKSHPLTFGAVSIYSGDK